MDYAVWITLDRLHGWLISLSAYRFTNGITNGITNGVTNGVTNGIILR